MFWSGSNGLMDDRHGYDQSVRPHLTPPHPTPDHGWQEDRSTLPNDSTNLTHALIESSSRSMWLENACVVMVVVAVVCNRWGWTTDGNDYGLLAVTLAAAS